ncbi:MAG: fumarylacetoacetate hydrolase family protein [Trueperaceae bacterium]|nr:MAG: fumarylacetoacetate hydrolase family protein [Trueperaceae bacterium]
MKRVRYTSFDGDHWGELDGGEIHQLTGLLGSPTGVTTYLSDVTLLPPCQPRTIICVGKNYAKHISEMGGSSANLPAEPGLFLKTVTTLRGPGDSVPYPAWTNELHYEGELAVVIARTMRNVEPEDALSYVLGYTCACDVTARDKQRSDLQWVRGKSADGFCPVGPWLETDLDPSSLAIQSRVNGELRQDGNTRDMIFSVPVILSYISSFMTLGPGDLVLTGTPEGVGSLHVGDAVEITVEGVGTLQVDVVQG